MNSKTLVIIYWVWFVFYPFITFNFFMEYEVFAENPSGLVIALWFIPISIICLYENKVYAKSKYFEVVYRYHFLFIIGALIFLTLDMLYS
tara:strand:- start:178 stop:447 length:270 start_codon:yes stop_codon:yes gene_type:complete